MSTKGKHFIQFYALKFILSIVGYSPIWMSFYQMTEKTPYLAIV